MIIGIGSDMIDIRRIEKTLAAMAKVREPHFHARSSVRSRTAGRSARPLTPSALPPRRPVRRRWAPAFGRGVFWRDLGVVNEPAGKPTMVLTGAAGERLKSLCRQGHDPIST